jgi:hypothetical protein
MPVARERCLSRGGKADLFCGQRPRGLREVVVAENPRSLERMQAFAGSISGILLEESWECGPRW